MADSDEADTYADELAAAERVLAAESAPIQFSTMPSQLASALASETRESKALTLFDLVRHEGYTLVLDPSPQDRPDARGNTGWKRMGSAQLCQNKQVAVTEELTNATYCISHEIAHGKCGFDDEKTVCIEQAGILAGWVELLMANIREGEKS